MDDSSELMQAINNMSYGTTLDIDSDTSELFTPRRCARRISISSSSGDELENDDNEINFENFSEILCDRDIPSPTSNFREDFDPKHMPSHEAGPRVYFDLFFNDNLLQMLVLETNRYAEQFLGTHELPTNSRAQKWKKTTVPEMRAFIAVLMEMGITKRPNIHSYWSKNHRYIPWFGEMFSRDRFQLLLKFLHTCNNDESVSRNNESYNPCSKFQPIVDHANNLFRYYFTPSQHLSVDESLVGTKSRTTLKQYLPNKKHHKWGIKFWMMNDSTSHYCLAFYCYRGARSQIDKQEIEEYGLAHTVVTKLMNMGNYFFKSYHVVMDNYFTSIPLARFLYQKGTYLTGTLRRNRKYIPAKLKEKFSVGQCTYFRQEELLLCGYKEKKSQRIQFLCYQLMLLQQKIIIKTVPTVKLRSLIL